MARKEILLESVHFKPLLKIKKIMKLKCDSHPDSAIFPSFLQLFIHIVIHSENID